MAIRSELDANTSPTGREGMEEQMESLAFPNLKAFEPAITLEIAKPNEG